MLAEVMSKGNSKSPPGDAVIEGRNPSMADSEPVETAPPEENAVPDESHEGEEEEGTDEADEDLPIDVE